MTRTGGRGRTSDTPARAGMGSTSLAAEIARLATLDLAELREQFRNHTGRIAPARVSRPLLLRVLAYRIQADAHGDLRPDTRRLTALAMLSKGETEGRLEAGRPAAALQPPNMSQTDR